MYQLAPRVDGVPGLNFSELEPVLRRFWDAAQLQPYVGSVNAVVQTLFDKARDDKVIHPAFDAMNQYLVELNPDFDLDDFMVRQSGLISRENIRDKSKRAAEKQPEKSIAKLKQKKDRRAPYAPTSTRISEQSLSLTFASEKSQIIASEQPRENLRMNTWLTDDPDTRKNSPLKAL